MTDTIEFGFGGILNVSVPPAQGLEFDDGEILRQLPCPRAQAVLFLDNPTTSYPIHAMRGCHTNLLQGLVLV